MWKYTWELEKNQLEPDIRMEQWVNLIPINLNPNATLMWSIFARASNPGWRGIMEVFVRNTLGGMIETFGLVKNTPFLPNNSNYRVFSSKINRKKRFMWDKVTMQTWLNDISLTNQNTNWWIHCRMPSRLIFISNGSNVHNQ